MRNPIIAAVRWLADGRPPPVLPPPATAFDPLGPDELERLGRLAHCVTLELETAYPSSPNATGALALRESLAELIYRATGDAAEQLIRPATFTLPMVPGGSYRLRLTVTDGAPTIYTGGTLTVEHESEPPPAFLRSVS